VGKNSLAVLAARLGPLGHGPGFGGVSQPGEVGLLPLNEKRWSPFTPGRVFLDLLTML